MFETISSLISQYVYFTYFILFIWAILEGEIALVFIGILIYSGHIDFYYALATGALGGACGDIIWFQVGFRNKQYAMKKLQNYKSEVALAKIKLRKYGDWLVFFTRFIYGGRIVIPIIVGITHYNTTKYVILNLISSSIWAFIYLSLTVLIAEQVETMFYAVKGIGLTVVILLVCCVIGVIAYLRHFVKTRNKKKNL